MNELVIPQLAGPDKDLPVCAVLESIMDPASARISKVPVGTSIRGLAPRTKFPVVCRLDGKWLLRAGWDRRLAPGQVVEFIAYPQGGNGGDSDAGRFILMLAAVYIAAQTGNWGVAKGYWSASAVPAVNALAQIAAVALVNVLVPVETGEAAVLSAQSQSPTYNASLAGNQARIDQPIPVLYGRNKTYPDFAAEPYYEYEDDDQYYNALFCLGQGHYAIETMTLDDTALSNFQDLEYHVLPPGQAPSMVFGDIISAPEVTGGEVIEGRYAGPFVACRPDLTVNRIYIDVSFSRGLATYNATTGNPENKSVSWRVEYRAVDEFGAPVGGPQGAWTALATENLTAAQTRPLRRSYSYDLPTACRPQVRLVRLTPFDDNSRVANTMEWIGLRCRLAVPVPLCSTATYIEMRIRASEQLSGMSQRRIGVISRRKLRVWNGTTWSQPQETRNFAWALADKWTDTSYGDNYPEDRCDLDSLLLEAAKADLRQDRFDAVFDQTYESFKADQMIANSARCSVFRRNGVMTLTRDEEKDLPVTAFTSRNIQPGSVNIDYGFATETTPDGVIVEYWSNRAWDWREVLCPAPGVVSPVQPQRIRLFGVTGRIHAEREGLYQAANAFYRRKFPSFLTEMEGLLVTFGSPAVFSPSLPGWGRGGDVVSYNTTTREVVLTEPVEWVQGQTHYLSVVERDGSLSSPPYVITPGTTEFSAIMNVAPTKPFVTDLAGEERTRYVIGVGQAYESVIRVLSLRAAMQDDGGIQYEVSSVIEDDRVHQADVHLLPADGEIQDPVDNDPDQGDGSGDALVVYLTDHDSLLSIQQATATVRVRFSNLGELFLEQLLDGNLFSSFKPPGEWLLAAPWTSAEADDFEIRATLLYAPYGPADGPAYGTWHNLGTERTWAVEAPAGIGDYNSVHEARVRFEIRDAATEVAQGSCVVYISAQSYNFVA